MPDCTAIHSSFCATIIGSYLTTIFSALQIAFHPANNVSDHSNDTETLCSTFFISNQSTFYKAFKTTNVSTYLDSVVTTIETTNFSSFHATDQSTNSAALNATLLPTI